MLKLGLLRIPVAAYIAKMLKITHHLMQILVIFKMRVPEFIKASWVHFSELCLAVLW